MYYFVLPEVISVTSREDRPMELMRVVVQSKALISLLSLHKYCVTVRHDCMLLPIMSTPGLSSLRSLV